MIFALAFPASADAPASLNATADVKDIQKYGNVGLSLTCDELKAAGYAYGDVVTVQFLSQSLDLPVCSNYSDVDSGTPGLFAREKDTCVLLAINTGDFATTYGIATKTTNEDKSVTWNYNEGVDGPVAVTISMKEPGGYRDQYLMHQLSYTTERADYPQLTDEQFANFRAVETTGMGKGVLYRTSSPVNPENGRSAYADAAMRKAGVTVVMNLAENEESVKNYAGYADTYYATTKYIALNMGVDFTAADFQAKLADGLRFFAENPGVYAVHCTVGKDRAGFVCALLEALMGASFDELAADYMATFFNYYGVVPGEERYDVILNSNLVKSLQRAFGVEDLRSADLAACAAAYMKGIGLSDAEIAALKQNLSAAPAPAPTPEPVPGTPAGGTSYVVKAGDCLWNIAYRFYGTGRMFYAIAEANGIKPPYTIYVGQVLVIPAL